MFVNVSHPGQLSDAKARRQVRSHISKRQHERNRDAIERAVVEKTRLDAQDEDYGDIISTPSQCDTSTARLSVGASDASLQATLEPSTVHEAYTEPGANLVDSRGQPAKHPGPGSCVTGSAGPPPAGNATNLSRAYQHHHTTDSSLSRSTERGHQYTHVPAEAQQPAAANHAGHTTRTLATHSYSQPHHEAGHVLLTTAYASVPLIHYSLEDSSDELQPFVKQMGTSVPALLVSHAHPILEPAQVTKANINRSTTAPPQYAHRHNWPSMRIRLRTPQRLHALAVPRQHASRPRSPGSDSLRCLVQRKPAPASSDPPSCPVQPARPRHPQPAQRPGRPQALRQRRCYSGGCHLRRVRAAARQSRRPRDSLARPRAHPEDSRRDRGPTSGSNAVMRQ